MKTSFQTINMFQKKGEILKVSKPTLLLNVKEIKEFCKLTDEELKDLYINPGEIRRLNVDWAIGDSVSFSN